MYVIPDKINGFNVYKEGIKQIGVSDEVPLPDVSESTSDMAGPGILGTISSPTVGQFDSMEMEIPFRQLFNNIFQYMSSLAPVALVLRGSIQTQDGEGNVKNVGMRVVVRGRKKSFTPGKIKQGEGTGSSVKLELSYLLIEIGGISCLEIDKLNSIYRVYGVDQLAVIRALC